MPRTIENSVASTLARALDPVMHRIEMLDRRLNYTEDPVAHWLPQQIADVQGTLLRR